MWVLSLIESNWFANGLQVYQKNETGLKNPEYKYYYGSHLVFIDPLYEIPLDDLKLEWIEIKQKRIPTFWEKLKHKLLGIEYDEYQYVRPQSEEIVIVDYGHDFYEVAEFSAYKDSYHWVTELNTYMLPVRWARIPSLIWICQKTNLKNNRLRFIDLIVQTFVVFYVICHLA